MSRFSPNEDYERTRKTRRASVWGFAILGIGVLGAALMMKDGFPLWSYFPFFVGLGVGLILWMRYMWKLEEWRESPRITEVQDPLDTTSAPEEQDLPESVILWLESATHGLGELAKRRIAVDIDPHYRDAYAVALEEGLAPADADRHAIKTLGNPHSARGGFRKVYLTKREEARIKKVYTYASAGNSMEEIFGFLGVSLALILAFVFLIGFVEGDLVFDDWMSMPVMNALMAIGLCLFFRWTRQGQLKRSHVVRLLMFGFFGFLWAPLVIFQHFDEEIIYLVGMGALSLFCIFFFVLDARMLGKLPKVLSAEEHGYFQKK